MRERAPKPYAPATPAERQDAPAQRGQVHSNPGTRARTRLGRRTLSPPPLKSCPPDPNPPARDPHVSTAPCRTPVLRPAKSNPVPPVLAVASAFAPAASTPAHSLRCTPNPARILLPAEQERAAPRLGFKPAAPHQLSRLESTPAPTPMKSSR
ncbi:hypothetical protein MSAN_00929000 [Mycena sanguinolenta]|uniref:Uncharacterized protein n=1 Tax=Mycena sanguinolenta TaxID=230812 RepID=A0A8H6YXW1_9AGAR|nr:hypothetical protein MSAN_00929000 [Mycena sanguinolenta]